MAATPDNFDRNSKLSLIAFSSFDSTVIQSYRCMNLLINKLFADEH
jgi:hypothetical protein